MPREVAARTVEAGDEADLDRVGADPKNDRDRLGRRLGGQCSWRGARNDDGRLTAHQIGGQGEQSIVAAFRPSVLDRHVAALDIAGFSQAAVKSSDKFALRFERLAAEITDHRHPLLRPRGARPSSRQCRAAHQRDELPPSHLPPSSKTAHRTSNHSTLRPLLRGKERRGSL
jgi:hypothetical protein